MVLRELVAASSLPIRGGDLSVTVSFGATLATPCDSPDSVLRRADQLLYRSKRTGRNRVSSDLDVSLGQDPSDP